MTRDDYKFYLLLKEINAEKAHDFLIKHRKMDKNMYENFNKSFINPSSSFDSWIEKEVYLFEFTKEEIESYIEDNFITICSAYDCTGKVFTRRIKIFPVQGKTIVYHFKSIDC